MPNNVLLTCPDLGLPLLHKGKVREMFDLGDQLLLVATDRLSAFDVVFPDGIPSKGRVLTQLSSLWFDATRGLVPNHLITTDVANLPVPESAKASLAGRTMVCKKAKRIDVECVVRGYLAGSGWKEYQKTQSVCGVALPPGLQLSSKLPEPIFTPALKNDVGHDENVSIEEVAKLYGADLANQLKAISIKLYEYGAEQAAKAGIILADTKFEFGFVDGQLTVIDEIFTPDSSRYWPQDKYQVGVSIDSLDKQPVRDWAEATGWNKQPPAPQLPAELITEVAARYQGVLEQLQHVLAK